MTASAASIYSGYVGHKRYVPHEHAFQYPVSVYSIPLNQNINDCLHESGLKGKFRRQDYLGDINKTLHEAVLIEASRISGKKISGAVTFFGMLSEFGFYFNPVNFYIIKNETNEYLLAEVTNTPWNEKHCYLINLDSSLTHEKAFHVSPYNPMDMQYRWNIKVEDEQLFIQIACYRDQLEFEAHITVKKDETYKRTSFLQGIRILIRIYYQALILFIKKTPIYDHPNKT